MPKTKSRKKKPPKRVLALPDLEHAKTAVLNSLTSASGQRTYDHAISEFVAWYCSEPRLAFNRTVVLRYRIHLEQRHYAPATINLRPAAVRRVAYEADVVGKVDTSVLFRCRPGFKAAIDTWTMAAGITHGAVFRAISKTGRIWGDGMTKALWDVVRAAAARADIEKLDPHELRWTCARLAIWPAANWIRFSSSLATSRSRRPSGILGASRSCGSR